MAGREGLASRIASSRAFAAVLAGLLAVAVFSSCLTAAALQDHDCTGDDCAICHVIATAKSVIASAASVAGAGLYFAGLAPFALTPVLARALLKSADTPVTLGVRLVI